MMQDEINIAIVEIENAYKNGCPTTSCSRESMIKVVNIHIMIPEITRALVVIVTSVGLALYKFSCKITLAKTSVNL